MKVICLLVINLIVCFSAHSQSFASSFSKDEANYLAYYKLVWPPDSNNANAKSSEMMRLTIGKKISCFESVGTHLADSLSQKFQNIPVTQSSMDLYAKMQNKLPGSSNRYKIYKNTAKPTILFIESLKRKKYAYVDSFPMRNWHLTDSSITLKGYRCQKATIAFRGRKYEAWFTREIPISEGPYKFCGLPGLIISLKDSRANYSFEFINIIKLNQNSPIELPNNIIITSRKALAEGKKDYYEGLSTMISSMPGQAPLTPAELEFQKKRIRQKFNNDLEIK
jgi:GLPGLI family protein